MTRSGDQTGVSTRQRLLQAAAEEIAGVGWDAARTRSVAGRAGVNAGVVHYHFDSMEALLLEAASLAMMAAIEPPGAAVLAGDDFVESVAESLRLVASLDMNGVEGRILMEIMVQAGRRPDVKQMMFEVLTGYRLAIADRVRGAIAAGEMPPGTDPEGMATLVGALLDGLALHRYVDPDLDVEAMVETTIYLMRGAG